mmetsp:Transcript_6603/g.27384  ORF Transcript_6603/g.27384 Transcript_6603/m.27384 type:complete len:543 (-) Transcript_6603:997-2625(-)
MENVVNEPRVISICLPVSTTSISLVGLLSRSTILPASLAAWVPVFIATATSAWASAGASLVPSPVIATSLPSACWARISASLASGVASARKSSTPASAAMAAAVSRLSPVTITVLMPMRRSCAKRSLMPGLTMSLSSTTPSTCTPSATTSGVLPRRAASSSADCTLAGQRPPSASTWARTALPAPLRIWRVPRSTPLMRVCAVNGMNSPGSLAAAAGPKRRSASATMLRPSGVSSAREARRAASANRASLAPSTGQNASAWRLPSVMVPVLSSSSTSTSPAASTARPEVAMTLACSMRLMPATPTADNRPAMVVGIRQTSSATSTTMLTGSPDPATATLNCENGSSVAQTPRNTRVSATSRMVSAISLGVRLRWAPSTIAIMRSTKVSPGLTATRATTQSDSTRVPPVSAEKSPPLSRMTGADSPVIALSSTDATPSTTSASAGTTSPASINTVSPLRKLPASRGCQASESCGAPGFQASMTLAQVCFFRPRSDAAWALLRPSARASAKLANSTVNHSHTVTAMTKPFGWAADSAVVSRLPR